MRHLLLDLDAPLMSFGGDMVDAYGVVRDFPAKSMIAGLLANALGWERYETDRHARLQERLVMGSARADEGRRIQDFQTAKLEKSDRGWTTRGRREDRAGDSYDNPHIRYRDADADARVLIALRLDGADEEPTLDTLTDALDRPERPLFLGRKPFLPSRPVRLDIVEAASIPDALAAGLILLVAKGSHKPPVRRDDARAQWPRTESVDPDRLATPPQEEELTDERHWPAGVHAGLRRVVEARLRWPGPPTPTTPPTMVPTAEAGA